ncbi:MAG: hypothetical protein II918_06285 [Firmicutes bacterium]|nr:hypothetical protein [Bacillota bacterium]
MAAEKISKQLILTIYRRAQDMNTQEKKRMTFICVFIVAMTVLTKLFSEIPFQVVLCNLVVLLVGSEVIRANYIKSKAKWLIVIIIAAASILLVLTTVRDLDLIIYTVICDVIVLLFGIMKLVLKRKA